MHFTLEFNDILVDIFWNIIKEILVWYNVFIMTEPILPLNEIAAQYEKKAEITKIGN